MCGSFFQIVCFAFFLNDGWYISKLAFFHGRLTNVNHCSSGYRPNTDLLVRWLDILPSNAYEYNIPELHPTFFKQFFLYIVSAFIPCNNTFSSDLNIKIMTSLNNTHFPYRSQFSNLKDSPYWIMDTNWSHVRHQSWRKSDSGMPSPSLIGNPIVALPLSVIWLLRKEWEFTRFTLKGCIDHIGLVIFWPCLLYFFYRRHFGTSHRWEIVFIDDGRIQFCCFDFMVLELCILAHCHSHWNTYASITPDETCKSAAAWKNRLGKNLWSGPACATGR